MNQAIIVAGFVVLLALLLYFMYKDRGPAAETPSPEAKKEPTVVKVKDYEAQLAAEKPAMEEPGEPTEKEPVPEEPTVEDLERLSGVGEKYRTLLRAAGVNSVAQVAEEDPGELLEKLREANDREAVVKRLPRRGDVENWVRRAKESV